MLIVEQITACGLEKTEALKIVETVNRLLSTQSPTACWYELSRYILTPEHPFALHHLLYETVYADFARATYGPPPAWFSYQRRHHRSEYHPSNDGIRHQKPILNSTLGPSTTAITFLADDD